MLIKNRFRAALLALQFSLVPGMCMAAEPAPAAPATPAAPGPEFVEDPKFVPPEPLARGKEFRPPGSPITTEKQPVIWGWRLTLPDGSGLAFGGRSLRTEDPAVHTQIRQNGEWKSIVDDLRKKNPLQPHHDALTALRWPLLHITGLSRQVYFQGRDEAAEKAFLEKEVAPKVAELSTKLKDVTAALSKSGGSDAYCTAQVALAQTHLAKVSPALDALGTHVVGEKLDALRQARIDLEEAADALDAEPPARAHSKIAYDAKSGLYAIFGGDHLDYLSNDLWVFDPKAQRWQQRHPKSAPEPRALHFFDADGAGKLKLRGGYLYGGRTGFESTYGHAGPDEWTYDLAADAWTGPVGAPAAAGDLRDYRQGGAVPNFFTAAPRPDPVAAAKTLAELPANTWVDLKPARHFVWNRDWGTLAFDADRDEIYWYTGGHSAYPGNDVAHYYLATNCWDQPVETELPPGYIGSNEAMIGWSFNRRPFMGHSYASYAYHPQLHRLIINGRQTLNGKAHDANTYIYDPDHGDWQERKATPTNFDRHHATLRYIPNFGMITWYSDKLWKFDDATLTWSSLDVKGKLPNTICDHCGMIFDAKRSRVLFFSGGSYTGVPYSGEVFALAIPSLELTSFKPEGSEHIEALSCYNAKGQKQDPAILWVLREVAHHPDSDLFLFGSKLPGGYMAALDAKTNRWVGLKIPGPWPLGLSAGLTYDAKRDRFIAVGTRADVSALKLDAKSVELKTFAEIAAENPKPPPPPAPPAK